MIDVETKTPTKRKSFSNKQGKKDSPKKAKLENVKTPQKNKLFEKTVTPKQQNPNKKQKFQTNNETPNKKNKRNADNESENGSQKQLKPFPGTSEIKFPTKKNQQRTKDIQKKDEEVEQKGEKKKRKDQYFHIVSKVYSGEKLEALKDIENKIKAIQSREGQLTKTAKRKLSRLNKLKNVCEGKSPVQVEQKKNADGPSTSTKRRLRKQKAKLMSEANAGSKVLVKSQKQTEEAKANGKANKKPNVNKQAVKKVKLEAKSEDSDDDQEFDDDSDESEAEEEIEGGPDSDDENQSDEEENEEEEDEDGEESEQDDEEESDEESEEESPPKYEEKSQMSTKKKEKFKKTGEVVEKKTKSVKDINLEELKKISLVNKNQKRYVLFVGNIPYETNKHDLNDHFKKCGEIKHIRIPTEKKSSKPRGFAYVEVGNEESYQKCLSMHHSFLKSRRINVLYTQGGKKKGDDKKKEIKAKNFKLHAMRKQGRLAGSKKENQKRSFRRGKQKASNKESDIQE